MWLFDDIMLISTFLLVGVVKVLLSSLSLSTVFPYKPLSRAWMRVFLPAPEGPYTSR